MDNEKSANAPHVHGPNCDHGPNSRHAHDHGHGQASVHVHGPNCNHDHHHGHAHAPMTPIRSAKVGRNDACPCGSGRKYKKCCLAHAHG